MRIAPAITLSPDQQAILERRARSESFAMACTVPHPGPGRTGARCATAGANSQDHGPGGATGGEPDDAAQPAQRYPLGHAHYGTSSGDQRDQCTSHLAQSWAEAAPASRASRSATILNLQKSWKTSWGFT